MNKSHWILCGLLPVALAVGCGPEPAQEPAPVKVEEAPSFPCGEVTWQALDSGTTASFRGLSAVSDDIVWVSGTGGTWGRTTDGGATWTMRSVPAAEELDFRDVDAFDDQTAYLMSAGPGELSRIYKTLDGGETWELQHTNPSPEGFYDGMAFWDAERGILYGDPVDGQFTVLTTTDGGATWNRVPEEGMPPAIHGEAGFAASGSGIAVGADGLAWFGTGGPQARVFRSADGGNSWTAAKTSLRAGESSMGIFSVAFSGPYGVIVGGDYTEPEATAGNAGRSKDGGLRWGSNSRSAPTGFRSAVASAPGTDGRVLITVGTSGSDYSLDFGETWTPLSGSPGFNAISFGSSTCVAWAAGPDGRLARLGTETGGKETEGLETPGS